VSSFWSALVVVFVAELGDKTQLVALGFGARYRLRWVLAGIGLAYVATNLMSVVIGALVGAALPGRFVRVAGGILFLAFAVWTMREPDGAGPDPAEPGDDTVPVPVPVPRRPARVVMSVAGAMFVAELGDKTMLATATLASTRNPVLVWAGATLGIFLAGALGATVGRAIGDRVPERRVRIGAAALFAAFGIALIVSTID
jgi:putative Ca2+/H+ antiporter (TMEM165/GDT1 family)